MTEQTEEGKYNIAVIGIGAMGGGMARALLESPISRCVSVYDRDMSLVEAFYQEARACDKAPPPHAATHDEATKSYSLQNVISSHNDNNDNKTHFCILVLQNEAQCEETCFGDEENNNNLLSLLSPGSTVLLTSTVTATWAKRASQKFTTRNIYFVDCPMSGGPVRARNGDLTIMASMDNRCNNNDDDDTLANCPARVVLEALGGGQGQQTHKVYWIKGGAGKGSTLKMVHQLLAGVHIVAAAEALSLAAKAGLNVTQVYDIVNGAAGASWMFQDRGIRMIRDSNDDNKDNVKSQMQIFVKDLDIVYAEAKRLQAPIPLASSALQQFISAQSLGLGQQDDSQVVQVYEAITGVPVASNSSSSNNNEADKKKTNYEKREGSNVGEYWKLPDGSYEEILEVGMEPRHALVLSNPYTRVLRVEFPPHDTTLAHRHEQDSLYFFLVPGGISIINHVQGHDPKCDCVDFGEVRYGTHDTTTVGGEALIHKITNTSQENKNLLCIDAEILKQPPITAAIPLLAEKHELIKTRDKCRIYQLILKPGESVTITYPFFHLTIVVQTGRIEKKRGSGGAGGGTHGLSWKEEEAMGAVAWNEPTFDLTKTNVGETTYKEYIAEWR